MKVAMCMFYDDAIAEYAETNVKINQKYCDKYGYTLVVSTTRTTNRHPAWEKIGLCLKTLDEYDYVIWCDADAHFHIHRPIEMFIKNIPFMFSGDKPPLCSVNTGVFIVKNCDYSKMFLKNWLEDEELYKTNIYPGWWDQGVLIMMMMKNTHNILHNSLVYNYGDIQHFDHPTAIVRHYAGYSKDVRINGANHYLSQLNS